VNLNIRASTIFCQALEDVFHHPLAADAMLLWLNQPNIVVCIIGRIYVKSEIKSLIVLWALPILRGFMWGSAEFIEYRPDVMHV